MEAQPARPDLPARGAWRIGPATWWIVGATLVGGAGLLVVVQIQDQKGRVPPTSMFAAAGIVMSIVALVTVTVAARRVGAPTRAAIAMGGGFAAITIAKFAIGPTALYQGNRTEEISTFGGLSSGANVLVIGVALAVLYLAAVWLLVIAFRPAPPPDGPSAKPLIGLVIVGALGSVLTGFLFTSAPTQYLSFALTGLEAGALTVALFVATMLVGFAFRDASARARALGKSSMYVTVAWVAIAFVLVFHVLWIVFLLAVVAIWPLRTVTPK
jgi:hypothetical protein